MTHLQHCHILLLLALFLLPFRGMAQEMLTLPRLEQLSSQHVTQVIQDAEGFLWYATEGGGVCRDDGRQMTVFRSDAERPDLLGSNDVASIAAAGRYIIIGTYHGANLLDKQGYSIRRLTEVDDKRVDDIIVSEKNGHWWLTSNKKVYEYADGKLLRTYPLGDKYIFRLREDSLGQLWAMEWEGGLLQLKDGAFQRISSHVELDSIDFRRVMADRQGRQLVADGFGKCYALGNNSIKPFLRRMSQTPYASPTDCQNVPPPLPPTTKATFGLAQARISAARQKMPNKSFFLIRRMCLPWFSQRMASSGSPPSLAPS